FLCSSRRRHTRFSRDWSSDVCSSDLIFLVQFAGIGLIGGIIGAILGSLIQYLIPVVMQDVIPVSLTTGVSWLAIIEGIGLGGVIAVLFALLPLLEVRNISPLNSLRFSDKETNM